MLSKVHLKLLDVAALINKTLSPLLIPSFGIIFGMLCLTVFTTVIFTEPFWIKLTWLAIVHTAIIVHHSLIMIGILWACESTSKVETQIIKHLMQIETGERNETAKVVRLKSAV